MNYWLLKSEPSSWSWNDQIRDNITVWDGVRNYQARNNLMMMKKGDLCFFYHSVSEKQIIGIVEVCKEFYIDPTDKTKKFVAVDVKLKKQLKKTVTLEQIKNKKGLSNLPLIKQSRLSVMKIMKKEWEIIIKMAS
ncbi:MAG: ubiquinol-cytochrome C reductase [Rickettsiales bacterium]|nr:ubiquinol-cytochrome C reductase [Rickettsiales bacterium]|tara:strand:+ start:7930 stop:8334 length:405 start_codon:yes stop_codon:yes gene_type:complete